MRTPPLWVKVLKFLVLRHFAGLFVSGLFSPLIFWVTAGNCLTFYTHYDNSDIFFALLRLEWICHNQSSIYFAVEGAGPGGMFLGSRSL